MEWLSWWSTDVHASTWLLALVGLCIGSFLNVVIYRLPLRLEREWKAESAEYLDVKVDLPEPVSLSRPRSRCPSCGHAITWYENIPVVSYLVLRGRCSTCKTRISPRYPLIELATGALFAAVAWRFGEQPVAWLWCGFVAMLVAMACIDWDTTLLPDDITLPLLWAGLLASLLGLTGVALNAAVLGAAAGYLSLWSVYWLFKLATGKEGMGYGDFKLFAAFGAWFGWQALVPIVLMASVIGVIVGLALKFNNGLREGGYVPFGPFLAGAGFTAMFFGPDAILRAVGLG